MFSMQSRTSRVNIALELEYFEIELASGEIILLYPSIGDGRCNLITHFGYLIFDVPDCGI